MFAALPGKDSKALHSLRPDADCHQETREHGDPMKAQFFQFNLGGRQLGWSAKILLSVLALVGIALFVSFGLLAVVAGVAIFAVMKLVGSLRQAFGLAPTVEVREQSWERSVTVQTTPDTEESVIVRDIEVEVLPAESERK
jgi:hypothetical protein